MPILADIFGVTVDELLRGEKDTSSDAPDGTLSEKGEKQLRYLMEKNFHRFQLGFWISLGTAFIGTLLSILLYEWVAAPGALIASIFAVAAILVVGVFAGNFSFSMKGAAFSPELIEEYRRKCHVWQLLAFHLIMAMSALAIGVSVIPLVPHKLSLLFPLPFAVAVVLLLVKKADAFRD